MTDHRPKQREEVPEEGIHTDFSREMTYGDYLQLDRILNSQQRLSGHHDEMLFIIIHQVSELWMKLILHELEAAVTSIRKDDLEPAFKMLARVSRIQEQLIQSWEVLSTLTPSEYMQFRGKLGHSSGFQSYQNRLIEFALGHKNRRVLAVYQHEPELYRRLEKALNEPGIYDVSIQSLAARGLPVDSSCLERDWSEDYRPHPSVEAAWLAVYRDVKKYWDLYELAEKLMDIEDRQQQWRYNHMKTVERIIGHKQGTGGSAGVSYLKRVLDHRFFPELWSLRTQL
ncbi:tryptophan 2,3-dioxygenase [Kroppenstedtia eburnea]|uniref:Tryptophan 2,3-dioxygenase n=1 Tax=Kroppenstedtia eburnea TaxID=714067 RepID=A0A1N7IX96_9BACL|nr:tryptophan 2,3-dioxygenase [Kroppenstedtia eburnea]EGK13568.1 tryptophan 2,3-dioxygenase [Desmospora sp. 8437]QKI82285.1 tryptophan 2,3-dioxygenase [Kroppenstedtia eburnea]SIS41684.1 tryptophan 2,3-dioxygenase [Kroppenstedtia eburnea]